MELVPRGISSITLQIGVAINISRIKVFNKIFIEILKN